MKLQQLHCLVAIMQSELNLTAAAARLGITQSAVSKQVKLLEDDLGFRLFVRSGRALTQITPEGNRVLRHALPLLQQVQNIKGLSADLRDARRGSLSVGTTYNQARYILPGVIRRFRQSYPDVQLHLHQGTSEQIAEMARMDRIDFAIATGSHELFTGHVMLPCYQWCTAILVPEGHSLTGIAKPTLEELGAYPLLMDVFSSGGHSLLNEIFAKANVHPNVAIAAQDSDVIKTYVRLGLGVGIVAEETVDPTLDRGLRAIDAAHLFPVQTAWVGFTRDALLRRYMYDFLQLLAPHLSHRAVESARNCRTQDEVDAFFADAAQFA